MYVGGYLINRHIVSRTTGLNVIASSEGEAHQAQLILTLGLALVIENGALMWLGSAPATTLNPWSSQAWEIPLLYDDYSALFLNKARSIDAAIAIAVTLGLYGFVSRTRLGKTLRAAAINPEAALYMGIDVAKAHHVAFGLGAAIAAVSGGLVAVDLSRAALRRNRVPDHHLCRRRARRARQHHRRLLGRHDHRPRAATFDAGDSLPIAERRHIRRVRGHPAVQAGRPVRQKRGARLTMRGTSLAKSLFAIAIVCAIWFAAGFFIDNSYHRLMLTTIPIWAVLGVSWNVFSGYSGLISFGHATFFGTGAYFVTLAMRFYDLTPWIGIPLGALAGALAALIVGSVTFRLRGVHFALAMLAYPLALAYVFEWLGFTEVTFPIKRDFPVWYMQFQDYRAYMALALGLLAISLLVSLWIERSRFGMSLLAIKQNELAAEAAGIDTFAWKMRALTLSGALAAAAGGLYATVLLVVTPQSVYGLVTSAEAMI